jgi:rhomboid protease GluP
MDEPDSPRQAVLQPLPPLIVVLALALAAVEAALQLGRLGFVGGPEAVGWRMEAMTRWGFSAPLLDQMVARREFPPGEMARVLSYGLVHASALHAAFAVVLLLALGQAVAARFSAAATAAVLLAGAAAGAAAYWAALDGGRILVGAYPAIYGLLGAFTWSLWMRAEGRGRWLAFRLVAVLIALQVGFRLVEDAGDVWVAEAGAFAAGFGLAFFVAPGGAARIVRWRERLRG